MSSVLQAGSQECVPAGENCDQDLLDDFVLADDDFASSSRMRL